MSARSTFKQEHPLGAPSPARDPLDNKPRGRESEISDVEGVHAARASSSSAGRARGFTRRARRARRASDSRASRVDLARARGANPCDRRPRASRPAPGRCSRAPRVSPFRPFDSIPAGRSVPPPPGPAPPRRRSVTRPHPHQTPTPRILRASPADKRQAEAQRIRTKYPDRNPVRPPDVQKPPGYARVLYPTSPPRLRQRPVSTA
jgi:hypothetical protein